MIRFKDLFGFHGIQKEYHVPASVVAQEHPFSTVQGHGKISESRFLSPHLFDREFFDARSSSRENKNIKKITNGTYVALKMKKVIVCIMICISSDSFSMTIEDITQLAIDRSSSLSAQEMESHALQYEADQKGKWQNPQVLGQIGTLKSGQNEGATIEVSFTQAVPLSDKNTLRRKLALIAVENQKNQNVFFKNWVSHQVILSLWRTYVTNELLKHGKERTRRLSLATKYLETRPRASVKQRVDLSILSSMLIQLERMQDQKIYEYKESISDLEFWIGKALSEKENPLKLPENYHFRDHQTVDIEKNLELIHAQNNVEKSKLDHELAVKEKRPDLFLGGGYRNEHVSPVNEFSYAIVGLNIPIWDTGSHRVASALARERRDEKNFEETKKRLLQKHQRQIELVSFSVEQLKRFPRRIINMNERAIEEAEIGFKQGLIDVNTFLSLETQSHEVIDQVYLSWMSYLENLSLLQLMNSEKLNWN